MSKRKKKETVSQIDYATVAKPHTSMYLMHKYWARKPHNVVSEYIQNYTKEGDIVLDPFCGSGPTPIEAIKLGRKSIGIDLNPISTFVTRMTAMTVDTNQIKNTFEEIKNKCKAKINELYKTKCKECGKDASIICTHWDNKTPVKIYYYCDNCNKKLDKKPDDEDLKLIKKIEKMDIPYWYPTQRLAYNGEDFKEGTHDQNINSVDKLFTKRNLISLSIIFNEISKIKEDRIKQVFLFSFTSMSHLASKMTPVRPTRPMSSFWAMHRYWIPPVFMESNVWNLFDSAVYGNQGIVEGKTDSNEQIKDYKEAKKFEDLNDGANIFLKAHNALELNEIIPKDSVDYVFTDPPYGGAVQYFELSTLWASWLKIDLNYDDEVTINKQQNKDFDYYHKMLTASFKQVYDVLKRGKYMTVTFHSTDIRVWTSIIKAVVLAGFDLEKIIYQPPARPSAKGLLQPYGSAVGDYYIRFKKPETERKLSEGQVSQQRYERIVVESAKRILAERGEPTIYQHILNGIIVELKQEGALLSGEKNPDEIMKGHLKNIFTLVNVKDDKGKTIGKKWWFKDPNSIPYLELVPLTDRVETAIVEVLHSKIKASFDDILREIFMKFPNALTPDTQNIRYILNEYADKTSDGKWILKPKFKFRESQHSKMIYLLGTLGQKLGFDVWIGFREQSEYYNKTKLSSLITNKKPVFRFIPTMNLDRVKQIDVLWYDEGRIKYEFEVENTTAITEAIVRGSNIPHNTIKRIIVIPKERERLLYRKLEEPILKESLTKDNWQFIFYDDLEKFYASNKRKKEILIKSFDKTFKMPKKESLQKQNSLKAYLY
jgi:16S rRNA G966 N2-methylase RsmD